MRIAVLRGLTALALLIAAALGAAMALSVLRGADDFTTRGIPPWSPELGEGAPEIVADAGPRDYPETFARPVFSPARRPFAPPPPPAEPEPEPPPPEPPAPPPPPPAPADPSALQLKGIMIVGNSARALIASPELPAGEWLPAGATVMGFKVVGIGDDSISLDAGHGTVKIKLYVDNQPNRLDAVPGSR